MNDKDMTAIKETKKLFIGFLLGGAIGGAIALLLAPKSGKLLKEDINRKTNELMGRVKLKSEHLWDKTKESAESTLDSANDFLNTGKEKIKNKTEKVKDAFKAETNAYNDLKKSNGDKNISSEEDNENTYSKIT